MNTFFDFGWRKAKLRTEQLLNQLTDSINKCADEEAGKTALIEFFAEYQKIKPYKKLDVRGMVGRIGGYYSFYIRLLLVKNALDDKRYIKACDEIISLDHFDSIAYERVYLSLMFLYRKYLE